MEQFGQQVLEPACGDGSISKVLETAGYDVTSWDLYDWGHGRTGLDFLDQPQQDFDAVITNPPFKLAVPFTLKALEFTETRNGKVAVLNRIQWLEGIRRKPLFECGPLSKVWVFSSRIPRMHRFDFCGVAGTSLLCFAWFVFDWAYQGEPRLGWLAK